MAALPIRVRPVLRARAVRAVTESRVIRVSACQRESNPARSAACPAATSAGRAGPPRKPSPTLMVTPYGLWPGRGGAAACGHRRNAATVSGSWFGVGDLDERAHQHLDAGADVLGLGALVRAVAVAVPAGHEEHGRRAEGADQLGVVAGVAGHAAPGHRRLGAGRLQRGAEPFVEVDGPLAQ